MKRPALLLVEWEDAFTSDHSWGRIDALPETVLPFVVLSVGYEIARNEKRITLAQTIGGDRGEADKCSDLMTIPTGMVRKVTQLRPPS